MYWIDRCSQSELFVDDRRVAKVQSIYRDQIIKLFEPYPKLMTVVCSRDEAKMLAEIAMKNIEVAA
jgi:hypothetical protein